VTALRRFLTEQAEGDLISWTTQLETASRFFVSVHRVEQEILNLGFLPARYRRNRRTFSTEQQKKIFESRVCVIGCGGLGGYVLEGLARLGVGQLVAVDFDVFEEHNLNRQLLATPETLGRNKAEAAAERIAIVNPAIEVTTVKEPFSRENGAQILAGSQVAVDALDSISVRLELAAVCGRQNIVLIHGAICGWFGQVATQYPGDKLLEKLYHSAEADKGMETLYGNPSFTPAAVAALQVAETVKALLGVGNPLRQRMIYLNLLDMELEELQL
jgi:molybdopterin-synthase adenylyltransferase